LFAVQLAGVALDVLLVRPAEVATAGDEDVEQAVAVVVDQGAAAADRFQDGVLVGLLPVAVGEADAGIGGHVAVEGQLTGLR
jgi:hypothetical protein